MNKAKTRCTSEYLIHVLVLIISFVIFDIWLIHTEYRNYQEKVDILCKMITSDDETSKDIIRSAAEILKGTTESKSVTEGKELLKAYGYTLDKKNALYDIFLVQSLKIIVVSAICCLLGLAVVSSIHFKKQKKVKEQFHLLEQILSDYRNEQYDASSQLKYEFTEDEIEKLKDEIVAFGDYLKLLNEKITYEKEETKSLVTDISHQLKTPVAALKTSFEILQQQDLKPNEKIEFMERCNLQISGIENLLSALLNISRMETGLIEIKMDNLILFETLLEAVNRVYLKADEKHIHIEMDAEELQELQTPHDRKWICEAVINLLDNAIKYSPSDTTITIRMMKRTTFLRLEIEDEGIGIPKSEYNRVFQRFYRGNADEVKSQPGSGVGLYLTREIISRHNGTIRVQTREPKPGSVFIIQLPYSV